MMTALKIFQNSVFVSLLCLAAWGFSACNNNPSPESKPVQTQGNPELIALTEQIEKDPKNDTLRYRRAAAFYRLEGYDEAILDLQSAITLDSMKPQYYNLLADVFLDYTKSLSAVRTMEIAASRFPENDYTLLKASEVFLIVKKHKEALEMLDKILKRDPQNAEAYYMAGRVALDQGDIPHAISSLKKSTQLDSDNPDAWEFLGRIYADKKDPIALKYYDNALRLDSTNTDIRIYKAMFHKSLGNFDKAFAAYKDVIMHEPDNPDAFFDLGIIYLEMDSLDKAYTHFDLAIKNDPIFVKAYYYRGIVSEEKGNADAAFSDYERATKMSPNFTEAKEAYERLKKVKK